MPHSLRSVGVACVLVCAWFTFPLAAGAGPGTGAPVATPVFTPTGSVKSIRQVQARFATPMVVLGDPRLPDPFVIDCTGAGTGRWVDARTWVYDFGAELPGGLGCRFTLQPGLEDLAGRAVRAARPFTFDTGGPRVTASLPYEGSESIDEEQVFLLKLDAAATPESVRAHARCRVEGLAESMPVTLVEGTEREAVLAQRRKLGYAYLRLLWSDGAVSEARERDPAFVAAERTLAMVRCQRRLPPGATVQLVWGRGIAAASGLATQQEQSLAFRVRPAFTARVECARVNPDAGCLPFKPIDVRFTSPVPRALALGVRLLAAEGERPAQAIDANPAPLLEGVRFDGPFAPSTTVKIVLPSQLVDDAGRLLGNAARFPLDVRVDEYPPLAKFAGTFGVLEAREGGVLPVTLRNLEDAAAAGADAGIPGRRVRVGADPAVLAAWLRRVEKATESRGDWRQDPESGRRQWRDLTGAASVFAAADGAESFAIAKPGGAREFEVVGIPLATPGLHVVELQSRRLGQSLLGEDRPRYVATAALVTNLAVHFKWGRESSIAWVTALDTGRPVAEAAVTVANYCDGKVRWTGRTDRDGIARIATTLGQPGASTWCGDAQGAPLLVLATLADDFSFALSSWSSGIEPWDFGMPVEYAETADLYHTVFDRPLFRPGETVSMKHYLRRHQAGGMGIEPGLPAERKVVVQHSGSDQRYETVARFDAAGIAGQQWTLPGGARTGDYDVYVADARGQLRDSGGFKVEDFRLPTMRAEVSGPTGPLVLPTVVPLDLHVAYLSGGGASSLPVTLRTYVEPRLVQLDGYDDYVFGGLPVQEGIETLGSGGDDADEAGGTGAGETRVQVRPLTLDASGAARIEVPGVPDLERSSVLTAELEYPDANGELLTATRRVRLDTASLHVGLRREGWVGTSEKLRFRVLAVDLDGRPIRRQAVEARLYQVAHYSYRKRLVGGFYAYETSRETRKLDASCAGRTDARGLLACEVAPGVSGEIVVRAEARDPGGRLAGATASMWVVGADDWWFGGTAGDRMDVLPERPAYETGDKARLQVRMPFRKATALVTVEREGVLDAFVKTLSGREPVVSLPITAAHAPNVFVSVLAVRGRVTRPEGPAGVAKAPVVTALVDLNKPAFRLGMAALRVGWKPHRLDVSVRPDRGTYRVRDTAKVQVEVRRADGAPLPDGAEVALAAVDEALLELAPNPSWQLLEAMMQRRGLQVWTSTAQLQVVGKRHYGRKAVPHGGGGGRDRARRSFDTLLLWQARVALDATGRATVDVPLNDSLSSFRIVAVASAGEQTFGTGSATIASSQELILTSGLPALVRDGDRFLATYTVRNTTQRKLRATVTAQVQPATAGALPSREVVLAPGEARDVAWTVQVPPGTGTLAWNVAADAADGEARDRLQVSQSVVAAVPVRVYQATLAQVSGDFAIPVQRPSDAVPGRGGVEVALRAKLADNLDGVREYMNAYPYQCLEQNLSRAIALEDRTQWDAWMNRLPAYLDGAGLLKYFVSEAHPGEDVLTAYVLTIASVAGWDIPDAPRQRMLEGLAQFVTGRIQRDSALPTADLAVRKLAAIAALARHGAAEASMLDTLAIDPDGWPTSAVLDWLDVLHRLPDVRSKATRVAAAEKTLRSRLTLHGTQLMLSTERRDALWWLMVSADSNAARTVLAALERPQWRDDVPRLVQGLLARQQRGHWSTTTANAWAVTALRRYSDQFEKTPVGGSTRVTLGGQGGEVQWAHDEPREVRLQWPPGPAELDIVHGGAGRPWALVQATAAIPLRAPLQSGFTITRSVTAIETQRPGRWTRGDVARVRLDVDAQQDATWVVVDDPIPAGATILGTGLGGQSQRLTEGERRSGAAWPAFEERRSDAFRAYYRFVPQGRWTVEYTVRLDNPGTFLLPPTRVEAMYAPEIHAERPNAAVTIEPR
ncbi:MAG TPA: MG2 domain-containing protein [Steroidobacteraceae bacterium]|nr:MG2 domain-containing protein [Steroidobacteraceae bacterium]